MSTSSLHSHKDEELNDSNKLDMMNDVELDDVMEKNETSTSHDDISTDYDLLRVDAGGLRGLIERIPLTIKLVIMCAVTLLGMMTIGAFMVAIQAKSLKTVRSSYLFQSIANNVGDYIAAMQTEREASLAFLANNATKSNPALKEAYLNAVDNSLAHFKTMNNKAIRGQGITTTDRNFGTILASMQSIEATLPTYRSFVIDTTIDTASIMRYYNGYLAVIVDFLTSASSLTLGHARFAYVGGAQPSAMSYVTMTRLVEVNELLRSLGRISFATGVLTDIRYRGFYVYVTQRKYVYSLWTNTAKASSIDYYNSVVSAESTTTIEMLENKLLDQINCVNCPIANITPAFTGYWSANMSARLEAHREVQKSLSVDMIEEARRTLRVSVATLVVLVVLIVFFFIISTATSYIAATTIIGPWARLNAIQEQAISKFVPKGFLRLLHCSRITDLSLGKVVQQPLTIMKLDIRDFAKFTKTFKKEEIFEYLNTYLDHVGPIIRKHKGFIDKHQGDGFTALFDSASQGLKASIEIQSASKAFNVQVEDKYPAINIGVGVHTGDMLVGTVGEDERWFHSVISQHASVADILERLSSKMSTGLLTTNSVIEKCSKSVSKHVELRVIGRINIEEIVQSSDNTPDASQIHVYEVLKPEVDSAKIATKVDFEEAVNLFYQHRYEEAVKRFDSIISQSPNDLLAIAYKQRATALNNQVRFTASNITLADTLASPALFHGMKEFCKSEYSSENIELWEMIEQYKKVDTGSERRNMAELISRDFLSLDGRAAVNINQQLKDNILQELSSTHDAAPNLFYSLQKELELVMGDTLKRYKATTFVLATLSQTYAPPRLDEL